MVGGICIINNSYYEIFFMKFFVVLLVVRVFIKVVNIEEVECVLFVNVIY